MRLIMKVKMAKRTVMTMISNKPTYNEDIQLSCLENSECIDWTTIFQIIDDDDDGVWGENAMIRDRRTTSQQQ